MTFLVPLPIYHSWLSFFLGTESGCKQVIVEQVQALDCRLASRRMVRRS